MKHINGLPVPQLLRDLVAEGELDLRIEEHLIPREMLYIADEVFFTGTAAEITPVASIDHVKVGEGVRGPVTERLQKSFFDMFPEVNL